MLVSCRMRPPPCSRIAGSTARVISAAAKKLTSICARNCPGENSSAAPSEPSPAILASTSMRPNRSSAVRTACARAAASVTSSATASAASGCGAASAWSASARRAASAARSPRARTASARARPKPLDAPVMNHVLLMLAPPSGHEASRRSGQRSEAAAGCSEIKGTGHRLAESVQIVPSDHGATIRRRRRGDRLGDGAAASDYPIRPLFEGCRAP